MFPSYGTIRAQLQDELVQVDDKRRRMLRLMGWAALSLVVGILMLVAFSQFGNQQVVFAIVLILVVTGIVFVVLLFRSYGRYREAFKQHVIRGVTGQLVENCSLPNETQDYSYTWGYEPDRRIHDHYIIDSMLFQDRLDEINGEDLMYGRLGLTDFEFSELHLIRIDHRTDSKGRRQTVRKTVFDGVLFVADFHKSLQGRTVLRSSGPMGIGRFFNRISNAFNNFGLADKKYQIRLENTGFNRTFDTYTTDEIEARYILSPTLMERLLEFAEAHRKGVEVAFVGERMYIALHTTRNYFEPKLWKSVADVQAKVVYNDLHLFFSMIEWFDLNTRIWNK